MIQIPSFLQRSDTPELMDDFSVDDAGLHQTLHELEIINHWLGGNILTINALKRVLPRLAAIHGNRPLRIADLGCGSGDMLRLVADRFENTYPLELIGIDANPAVVRHAMAKNTDRYEITYQCADVTDAAFGQQTFDVVLCTLFLHHFPEQPLVALLGQLHRQTTGALIINDLHRHPVAYYAITALTRLFSRSYMTRYDAKLSVLRGFFQSELQAALHASGWIPFELRWLWAFRWQVIAWQTAEILPTPPHKVFTSQ